MNWFTLMGDYLGGWPENYVVFDVETQGLEVNSPCTLACQLGWCVVEDCEVTHAGEIVVDWTAPDIGVDIAWLAESLERTRQAMAKKNLAYHCSIDRMRAEGAHPREAARLYHDLLAGWLDRGASLVGHNCWAFDRPLLARHFRHLLADEETVFGKPRGPVWSPMVFDAERIVDTGMIEKSRGMCLPPPEPGVPRGTWYNQIFHAHSRASWNLGKHCAEKYDLSVEQQYAHDAGYDCRVNAMLLERMRYLACAQGSAVC